MEPVVVFEANLQNAIETSVSETLTCLFCTLAWIVQNSLSSSVV
jgi:hypothetical protein